MTFLHTVKTVSSKVVKNLCRKGTERVFVMHGDKTESFAQWISEEIGVDAYVPANGELFAI
jgi:putative mRNA 3-end processing factor